jgi:hypothetical protein
MLESHHSLVVKALQKLYKFCITNEPFPGDPLAEAPDGHPLTHAILDRLGLIKQAEENADEPDEDSEDLRYLRLLSTSTECSVTAEPSPEPTTPPEPFVRPAPVSLRQQPASNWHWDLPYYPDGYDLMPRALQSDIPDIQPVEMGLHESYPYAIEDVKPVTIPGAGTGRENVEMMGDFQYQGEAFYPGFTPGWTFPSG